MVLLTPLTASATPTTVTGDPSVKALYRVYTNNRDGHTSFESDGEHLFACDDSPDGDTIRAEAYWNGATRAKVIDTNGFGGGCGETDQAIAEGTDVNIRVCHVEDHYCSGWKDAEA